MRCKPVLVYSWGCDGCGLQALAECRVLPDNWTDRHVARLGPYTKQLVLCPNCSVEPSFAIRAWQGRFSTFPLSESHPALGG